MRYIAIPVILLLCTSCLTASAIEAPSLSLGKSIFESTQLGTSGRSCDNCHPQGKGLDKVADFNDLELKDIINACIRDAQKGQTISPESQEMNALLGYVRTFQITTQ